MIVLSSMDFLKGVGVGMAAGAAVGMTVMSAAKSKGRRSTAGRALKAAGEIVENISCALGI